MNGEFKVNNFDLLRIFAATEVLFIHSLSHFGIKLPLWLDILSNFSGVPMFFVISGFLISAAYERNSDLKIYFSNRAYRIFPALWVCLLVTIVVISVAAKISFINSQTIPWFIAQCVGLIYTPSFLENFGFGSYNGSLWTIPIELQFYLVLPAAYWAINKVTSSEKKKTVAVIVLAIVFTIIAYLVARYYTVTDFSLETRTQKLLRYSFVPHVFLFFVGNVLQRAKVYQSNLIYNKGLYWAAIYLAFCYIFPGSVLKDVLSKILLGVCTISLAYSMPKLSAKVLRGNDISYGVYIYHGLIIGVLVHLKFMTITGVMIVFAGAYVLGYLSWIAVEHPILKFKKRSIRRVPD
ncbi:acyltransferase family protein [Mucilaginibacter auburnensis]|uniref:Peptidoglycan/LPS O-acetylase OafA/YrhL n=1 Tax=Mucilaginibacter auburnensis TaxID=1457233 RepID=A0A2H9VPP0_9SPHI|nr:acyltransferase [Mucilaginibacter auburnensis]PJJ80295.1 peptidoglycan/LPS O-acetylase OafA/YrhL [Mucilaginibacter auburnensis]